MSFLSSVGGLFFVVGSAFLTFAIMCRSLHSLYSEYEEVRKKSEEFEKLKLYWNLKNLDGENG
jgi:hypothetical protein